MEVIITCSIIFIAAWLILKPFMLLVIEKENEKYEKKVKRRQNNDKTNG